MTPAISIRKAPMIIGAFFFGAILLANARTAGAHLFPLRETFGDFVARSEAIAIVHLEGSPERTEEIRNQQPMDRQQGRLAAWIKPPADGAAVPGQFLAWLVPNQPMPAPADGAAVLMFLAADPQTHGWISLMPLGELMVLAARPASTDPAIDAVRRYEAAARAPAGSDEEHNETYKALLMGLIGHPNARVSRDALEEAFRFQEFWKRLTDADVDRLAGLVGDRATDLQTRERLALLLNLIRDRIPFERALALLKAAEYPGVQVPLVRLVGTHRRDEGTRAILPLMESAHPSLRLAAYAQVPQAPSEAGVEAMLKRLPKETEAYLVRPLLEGLFTMGSERAMDGMRTHFAGKPEGDDDLKYYRLLLRKQERDARVSTGDSGASVPRRSASREGLGKSGWWAIGGGLAVLILGGVVWRGRRHSSPPSA